MEISAPGRAAARGAAQLGVPRQRRHRVLDAGARRVVDADDRAADHRHPLHQPGDLAAEHLADRALEHRLVWLNTPTGRPLMVPCPVTTPSPYSASGSPGSAPARRSPGSCQGRQRVDARTGAGNALLVALGGGLLTTGFLGQLELFAEFAVSCAAVVLPVTWPASRPRCG